MTAVDRHDSRLLERSDPHVRGRRRRRIDAARRSREPARAPARRVPIVVGDAARETVARIASTNPARPTEVIASVGSASLEQALEAVEAAAVGVRIVEDARACATRAGYLFAAAALVRERRDDFNALLVLEVGKPWIEADADTAEAIDFLEFYAREALRYADAPPLTPVAGEDNRLAYIPLGVGVVIPPWNFAFAIMAGMTVGGARRRQHGRPQAVERFARDRGDVRRAARGGRSASRACLQFVPGSGRTIGDAIVAHALTRFIAFTGSKEVGLHINELAAKTQPGQRWIKRVIAEMGGKDSIVVAADADLDAAADGIVASAFGFSRARSAARARVRSSTPLGLRRRRRDASSSGRSALRIGDPSEAGVDVGPVINEGAMDDDPPVRPDGRGRRRHGWSTGGERVARDGWFVQPTVVADVQSRRDDLARGDLRTGPRAHPRARLRRRAARSRTTPSSDLTGSLYSSDEAKLERARAEFFVGNLYLNRKCTGALVGGHPFGGFNMSGTDSKAGGYDYLMLFTQAKTVSRKVDARGTGRRGGE